MANTSFLTKSIYPYVLKEVNTKLKLSLVESKIAVGSPAKEKKFDGVSADKKTILSIFTSSGYSKSGKLPVGKINALYATCYMMNLTGATRKILAFSNEEFMKIIIHKCKPFLEGFELIYVQLSDELKELCEDIGRNASDEMG